jgi:enamine deaminase RidA (YjgF/YER057c/UK114 family)
MDQLKVTLGRVVKIVGAEGGTAQDIVKITTFVTKISDWYPVDQAQIDLFNEVFDGQNPANSLVEITALAIPGLDIEIEAIVVLG